MAAITPVNIIITNRFHGYGDFKKPEGITYKVHRGNGALNKEKKYNKFYPTGQQQTEHKLKGNFLTDFRRVITNDERQGQIMPSTMLERKFPRSILKKGFEKYLPLNKKVKFEPIAKKWKYSVSPSGT